MNTVIENLGKEKLIKELNKLNPGINARNSNEYEQVILVDTGVIPNNLKYPEGYYFSEKLGINNKHNTTSGMYEYFLVLCD